MPKQSQNKNSIETTTTTMLKDQAFEERILFLSDKKKKKKEEQVFLSISQVELILSNNYKSERSTRKC